MWDYELGDFAMDGAGRIVIADGHTAWVHWCIKAVLTERFSYPVYSQNHGTEMEGIAQMTSRREAEAQIIRTITEALMVDPRTEMVRDFSFAWAGDQVSAAFTAVPVVGPPAPLEVRLHG